jgi:hypothetical protein
VENRVASLDSSPTAKSQVSSCRYWKQNAGSFPHEAICRREKEEIEIRVKKKTVVPVVAVGKVGIDAK